jgi:tetratricopeptide (TPR) repeat protein
MYRFEILVLFDCKKKKFILFYQIYYYSIGDYQNFKKFSEELSKTDVDLNPFYRDQKQIFIYILNIFSFFYSLISQQSKDKVKSDNFSTLSTTFVNQAEKISMYDPMTMICKGFLFFAQGDYDNSEMYFSNISDNDKNTNLNKNLVILAKIGRGLNSYNKGNYNKALVYFVSLIRDHDYFNENVFECLALCYYNSGKVKKAKEIFEKVLEMNPNNYRVQTYISILSLVSMEFNIEEYQKSFQKIKDAFVNDENSDFHLLLIQLANIFLLSGKVNSAEEIFNKLNNLLEYGEMRGNINKEIRGKNEKYRRDLDEIKSSIYCINAKIMHLKKNNTEAFTY